MAGFMNLFGYSISITRRYGGVDVKDQANSLIFHKQAVLVCIG